MDELVVSGNVLKVGVNISEKDKAVACTIPIMLYSGKNTTYAFVQLRSNTYIEKPNDKHSINSENDMNVLQFTLHEYNLPNNQIRRYLYLNFKAFPNGVEEASTYYRKQIKIEYVYLD
jgi:hypothetical protein